MSTVPSAPPAAPPSVAWWERPAADVAAELGVDPAVGLSSDEAADRLEEHGPNELVEQRSRPRWRMILDQFANTMIVVLLVASGVTAALGEYRDTIVILAIVVLNAAIGSVQEHRAERAMEALKELAAPTARVLREATVVEVPATELVPGDILLLEAGDVVAADGRLFEAASLRVNESALTGESVPVDKTTDPLAAGVGELVADRRSMVAKGTAVTYGRGRAVVTATGMETALGSIADMLQSHQAPDTPLQKRLAVLGRRLAVAALMVCLVVFVAGVSRGEPVSLMFLTAVSLAVAAIPEALPAVVTMSLALGAQRMVRRHAIVRKLPAVETLGSVTVICTDKTGTLTEGSMVVERVWTPTGEYVVSGPADRPEGEIRRDGGPVDAAGADELAEVLRTAVLCNDAELAAPAAAGGSWTWTGDPTEVALLMLAERAGIERGALLRSHPRVAEVPFDADRKRMTTLHRDPGGGFVVAAKGAPEALLPLVCLDGEEQRRVANRAAAYAADGYRVLAIAGEGRDEHPDHPADAEEDLDLLGLVAMADPPRPEAAPAVADCRTAGIRAVMITGDHPATGRAIADRIGILGDHRVMTGSELAEEGVDGLARHVADVAVYARTTPRQKLDIVGAWKERGDVVAMTGDGVNDAPALRRADIGVAMGIAGTEVSKEAADMVLTDDDFATIVHAVEEGRRVYDNIRRFVRYTLTSNSGEIWVMFLAPFLGLPLPLLPVQILWINLVTDGLPGLALGVEPPSVT